MIDLPSRYNPKDTEDKWYSIWSDKGYFSAKVNPDKKPFSIVIPPPNVTGILHMGHALNNTIQDILVRYHRMIGEEALWMPGTDHAGIATQNVVEKSIAKGGLKRQDLGRDKFIERVWQWKELYGSTIIHQLKKLGASCDWQRTRFTMDDVYSKSVLEVFVRLYEKGLIYRGSYIINWCPRCQTALSDEEAPHHDLNGNLYHLKYPLKDSPNEFVIVATTRPETMLGDTAVAVNPKDKRYKLLIGKYLILPLVNREIKIISDPIVDMKFGTGAVKVTPAHDPNDYAMGKKHGLEFINVMTPDGRMNSLAGDYQDMDRFEAREVILEDLKVQGFLEKVQPHHLSAGHCYRCHTIIEPYLSKQWFVKMKPLAKPAIEAVKKGRIKFFPSRWTKVYLNWMENIQDWCISRQIWWGHRIPVYYCKHCEDVVMVSATKPEKCTKCGSCDIYQDEDVLDTWFSSWLWPFATFNWPKDSADLKYFYPTSALVTAPEIIFFWVARMIMAGFEFMGDIPFKDVYIHGTVRDIEGKKMSKSLGNIIDPLEIINEYGTDALRFSLISITSQGQDVYLSKERFEQGRNFANKIWNASRFILMNLDPAQIRVDLCQYSKNTELSLINRWILSRLYSTLKEVSGNLKAYRFNEAANLLYNFFWHEFCDWYLEMIKPEIHKPENQVVMYKVLEKYLRSIHPFMPFISEEIWQILPHEGESIMTSSYPHIQQQLIDKIAEEKMSFVFEIITSIRNMRQDLDIPVTTKINCVIATANKTHLELSSQLSPLIKNLARVEEISVEEKYVHLRSSITSLIKDTHVTVPLEGLIDIDIELTKINSRIIQTEKEIGNKKKMLSNMEFLKKAPDEIVENVKTRLAELTEALKKLKAVKDGLR
ncbi:MAG: valine--tRNA ligase [Candidatus Omnitrophica bacterium]|nr:valine--tRNA ligase [Candidatus Omnitrophota bacterium]